MSMDREERARRRRLEIVELILRAGDAGEIVSVPDLKGRLPWGGEVTKHGLLFMLNELEEQGFLERRWGKELGEKAHGKTSYVIPLKRAYEVRARRV